MGLHDFGRRLRALGVWSSGWAVWGYMTLAEGLEPYRGVVIRLGCVGLHDFDRRLRALWVWSSGWAVWGYAEGS